MDNSTIETARIAFLLIYLWVVVPGILIGLWFYAVVIASEVKDQRRTRAAWAGIWAGLVAFIIYSFFLLHEIRAPIILPESILSPSWWWVIPLVAGFFAGFSLLVVLSWLPLGHIVFVGFTTLLISFASLATLFSYVFQIFNIEPTPLAVLGGFLGALVYRIFAIAKEPA